MNYYQPAKLTEPVNDIPAGKYVYIKYNRREGSHLVGYCAQDCVGHDTKEEACEHYRLWLIDNARYNIELAHPVTCEVCGAWTNLIVELPRIETHHLCSEHQTREHLKEVVPEVGHAAASV